jgi:hypothetical protein
MRNLWMNGGARIAWMDGVDGSCGWMVWIKLLKSLVFLTPKGLWVPYMEFRDFRQTAVNAKKIWIF